MIKTKHPMEPRTWRGKGVGNATSRGAWRARAGVMTVGRCRAPLRVFESSAAAAVASPCVVMTLGQGEIPSREARLS